MSLNLILIFLFSLLVEESFCMKVTRVRILRSDQEKLRFLGRSKYMRENLFFGMRPILYIQKYQNCDCGTSVGGAGAPSGSNTQLDPPVFPDDGEVVPPSEPSGAIVISTTKGPTTTPATEDHRGQQDQNNKHSNNPYGSSGDQEEEEEFELLLSNNGEEAHIVDEGFPHSSSGGSIRVGGGTSTASDGFPNDPFGRPFLLTIRANPKNRRQNGQNQKGNSNSNNGNRSRRRRPSSPSVGSNTVPRQVHGSLHQQSVHQQSVHQGPGHHLGHQVMGGGGQFMIHQQGSSMFNSASSSDGSFLPLSAFIIPPQQNSMNPLAHQSMYDQQQQLYQQQAQNYQRQLQLTQSNQHDHSSNQPPLNPGFGHVNINTNERKQG